VSGQDGLSDLSLRRRHLIQGQWSEPPRAVHGVTAEYPPSTINSVAVM
jgi:hypothetical protein